MSEAVKEALEVIEAQCEAVTRTLQGKLRKAWESCFFLPNAVKARFEDEFLLNLRLLQDAFKKLSVPRMIPSAWSDLRAFTFPATLE